MSIVKRLTAAISCGSHNETSDAPSDETLTRDHVIWGYRLFLDREPENEAVVEEKVRDQRNTRELRRNFMLSSEFGEKNPELTLLNESHVVIAELAEDLRLFVDISDSVIGWEIIRGRYEAKELDFVRRTIKPGQTVIDIGANIGVFTITLASLVGPNGMVFAFEPMKNQARLLDRSVAENDFKDRVILERAAVSNKPGKGQLISAQRTINAGGAYLKDNQSEVPRDHETSDVEMITLDTHPLRRPVSFIKIDIEGAEPLALRGARQLLKADRPVILSEIHPAQLMKVSGYTASEFVVEMTGLGYKCHELDGAELVPFREEGANVKSVVFLPSR